MQCNQHAEHSNVNPGGTYWLKNVHAHYIPLKFLVVYLEPFRRTYVSYLELGVVGFFLILLCHEIRRPAQWQNFTEAL
jgi:hypothetical protein